VDSVIFSIPNGFALIQPPFFLKHQAIRPIHKHLLEVARSETAAWGDDLSDEMLFAEFGAFYAAIGAQLDGLDPGLLNPRDRHRLFICAGTIEYQGQTIPDLSLLEKLMGYEYDFSEPDPSAKPPITSGDADADLIAACNLVLGVNAAPYMERFSRPQLLRILEQTHNLQNREEVEKQRQQEADKELFSKNEAAISAAAKSAGINIDF
jgi:hypothetical protein